MKTFKEFILEVYDPEVQGRSQIRTQGQGGRVGADRKKTEPEKRRVKAVGGGKTAPAKDLKIAKILVLNVKDLNVSNNQHNKEVLLSYQQESSKRKQEQKD